MGRPSRRDIYSRFETAIRELDNYGGLPKPHEAPAVWDGIWHLEAHHSTALEGNTLVLREVEQLLAEKRAVGSKALKDYLEVLGYGEAAQWVYTQAVAPSTWQHPGLINVTELRNIHRVAMTPVWDVAPHEDATSREAPGSFREHDIHPFGGGMKPPSHVYVGAHIETWIGDVNELRGEISGGGMAARDVPERLAALHCRFEQIHPFIDGNGRTGRLVLNLILVRLGWPPAIIFKRDRAKYLRALDRADRGEAGPLAELISRSVESNLHLLIPRIAGTARYVPLKSLVTEEMTYPALRAAAMRGRLAAIKDVDGTWRSSRHHVDEYLAGRWIR